MSTDQIAETPPVADAGPLSAEEYLRLERDPLRTPRKTEWIDGRRRVMPGVSRFHDRIFVNLIGLLMAKLDLDRFVPGGPEFRTRVPRGPYYYPDVIVMPAAPRLEDDRHDTLLDPLVIFEILSPSTEAIDRGEKRLRYAEIPSLTDYVLVSQRERRVEHFTRQPGSTAAFEASAVAAGDDEVRLDSVGVVLPLAETYRGVLD